MSELITTTCDDKTYNVNGLSIPKAFIEKIESEGDPELNDLVAWMLDRYQERIKSQTISSRANVKNDL